MRYSFALSTVIVAVACTATTTPATTAAVPTSLASSHHAAPAVIPGIPNAPEIVTVIPFYEKPDETDGEETRIMLPADVDGRHGLFLLDMGIPDIDLNRNFLRPNATGGVDTVLETDTADAHRLPDWPGEDSVHIMLRIGTLWDTVVNMMEAPNPRHINAFLNHAWEGNPDFAPRLGSIGLAALEPFETILDYTHRRVVLIRLDARGRRLVDVPAYTAVWSAPLVDIPRALYHMPHPRGNKPWWGVRALLSGVPDSLLFDTGAPINAFGAETREHVPTHPPTTGTLDSLVIGGRTLPAGGPFLDASGPQMTSSSNLLGYPFMSNLGVVGFNHRTHQFILYR